MSVSSEKQDFSKSNSVLQLIKVQEAIKTTHSEWTTAQEKKPPR